MSNSLKPHGQQDPRSSTPSWSLLKFMSIESVMLFNHLILCHSPFFFLSIFPSIRASCNESALHIRWSKYWRFGISPFNEYSGLISFRIDWLDLFAVQGTLKSSPEVQFESINSSRLGLLNGPALTSVHDYWITTIALTIWTFVSKGA